MRGKRRFTLYPSTIAVLESMGLKAWVHDNYVRHSGGEEVRERIRGNLERVREAAGVKGTALYFGAALLTAMEEDTFTEDDISRLDPMGKGNASYILEKLREAEK
jgi:hypothetical protein